MRRLALAALCCVAAAGCGGSATPEQEATVRTYLPEARSIDCTRDGDTTSCEAEVRKRPVGAEHWTCEFSRKDDGGSSSCFSEDGSRKSLTR